MREFRFFGPALRLALTLMPLAACAPDYSPDKYASNAVQQANKVEQGVIVGSRPVVVNAQGIVGAATGGAVGGAVGSQAGNGFTSTLGAIGGTVVGGLVGNAVERTSDAITATEYVVRKTSGDLVSVTQKDEKPLANGQKVLVIAGAQARIVPDYTVAVDGAGIPAHPEPPSPSGPTALGSDKPAKDQAVAPTAGDSHSDGLAAAVPPPVPVQAEPLGKAEPATSALPTPTIPVLVPNQKPTSLSGSN